MHGTIVGIAPAGDSMLCVANISSTHLVQAARMSKNDDTAL
jgi:hypothetical protein